MRTISLGGAWQMREAGTDHWHEAQVPGSVYADLLRDGSMADPFWRDNEKAAFELLKKDYEYRHAFLVEAETLQANRVVLCCKGLDTLAHVFLNGKEIAYADNMHITWQWDVKEHLRLGENELSIRFDSPINYATEQYEQRPCWCAADAVYGFQHIRKAHCMFGWDWGPRLPDAGIWRDISLLCIDEARIESVLVLQEHSADHVTLQIQPDFDGTVDQWCVEVIAPSGEALHRDCTTQKNTEIAIKAPQLWWPNGYGEQPLYTVRVTAYSHGVEQDTWTRRVGLRTLTVSRDRDEWGEEFCHVVNGVKIFAMGADYIPEDNILDRVTAERTHRLLEDAKLANFNCIRVWGGGYYPDDYFFDICDELGLMVWQDLMYACATYDLTSDFERSIRLETEQNVKRIRHHACLALLCGNNEVEDFMKGAMVKANGDLSQVPQIPAQRYADYIKMFEYVLPAIVKEHAPQTFWWPSSPSSGGGFGAPNSDDHGDVHFWSVWGGLKPYTEYRQHLFRYVSEFGFQSFPGLKTVEAFTEPEDRNIFSRVMEFHQRNRTGNTRNLTYIAQLYKYPASFDHLLYASQIVQAEAIRYGVEHWRRYRGRCMGAIIWQLNDCWPVASWASIDYFGRWKALHYAAKRFFSPVMISVEEKGEMTEQPYVVDYVKPSFVPSAHLNVANETMQEITGEVRWELCLPDGTCVRKGAEPLTIPALSAVWLDELLLPDAVTTRHCMHFAFAMDGEVVSEGVTLFCAPKHYDFIDPKLEVYAEGDEIVVTSKAYARFVFIESADADLLLEDNYFDMMPGTKRIRVLRGSLERLRVRSVYDLDKA